MKAQNILKPFKFLDFSINNDVALILLNQKWYQSSGPGERFLNFFDKLWRKSKFSASVDGGTNTLHKLNQLCQFRYIPELISGDFDSVKADLLTFYKSKGTEVIPTPDQDYTDFTKSLRILGQKISESKDLQSIESILCLVGKSDRVDHVLSNLNTLFTCKSLFPAHINLCLLARDSCSFLLPTGSTQVEISSHGFDFPTWCKLIPLQYPVTVTTAGLKRNLSNELLTFGSFSNLKYELGPDENITVETDHPLIFILPTNFF